MLVLLLARAVGAIRISRTIDLFAPRRSHAFLFFRDSIVLSMDDVSRYDFVRMRPCSHSYVRIDLCRSCAAFEQSFVYLQTFVDVLCSHTVSRSMANLLAKDVIVCHW